MLIYIARNKLNDKVYIGKTKRTLFKRIKEHKSKHITGGSYFHKAMRCYGFSAFEWSVLKECSSIAEMNNCEKKFIHDYDSRNHDNGYNISEGGEGGDTFTSDPNKEIRRNRMKEKVGILNPFYGKKHSEETLKIIGENSKKVHTGRKNTKETKKKMSISAKGTKNSQNKLSLKDVLKIKNMLTEKKMSQSKIAEEFGVSRTCISAISTGRNWFWV